MTKHFETLLYLKLNSQFYNLAYVRLTSPNYVFSSSSVVVVVVVVVLLLLLLFNLFIKVVRWECCCNLVSGSYYKNAYLGL